MICRVDTMGTVKLLPRNFVFKIKKCNFATQFKRLYREYIGVACYATCSTD